MVTLIPFTTCGTKWISSLSPTSSATFARWRPGAYHTLLWTYLPLPRPWYFATGGWPQWSRSCSSSLNTRSSTSFPTSQSAGEKRIIIPVVAHTLLNTLDPHHENCSKLYLRWDHWILDVLICNLGGTIIGIYTLRYFSKSLFDLWRPQQPYWSQVVATEDLSLEGSLRNSDIQVCNVHENLTQIVIFHPW